MALVLDGTVGGVSANTYVTLAAAETYFEGKLHKDVWSAAANADKNIALVEATRTLDAYYVWAEYPTDTTTPQALSWPRVGVLDSDRWTTIDDDDLPDELAWATCELALAILTGDRTADSDVETQGLLKLVAGSVELEFKDAVYAKPVPDIVVNLIPEWWGYLNIQSGGGLRSVPIERA